MNGELSLELKDLKKIARFKITQDSSSVEWIDVKKFYYPFVIQY